MKKHFAISMSLFTALMALTMMSTSQTAAQEPSTSTSAPSLDFEFFKTRVEPIFLKKRPGHARCYVCHAIKSGGNGSTTGFRLEMLLPASTFWTEEQSRRNFEVVSLLVIPGEPLSSRLLIHPLAPGEGGDIAHGGAKQFASKGDPDWLTLAEWVRGQKSGGSSDK